MPSILDLLANNPTLRMIAELAKSRSSGVQQPAPPQQELTPNPPPQIPFHPSLSALGAYPADTKSAPTPSMEERSTEELRSLVDSNQFSGRNLTEDMLTKGGTGFGRFFRGLGRSFMGEINPESTQLRELFEQARIEGSPIRRSILDILAAREEEKKQASLAESTARARSDERNRLVQASLPRSERIVPRGGPFRALEVQSDFDPTKIAEALSRGVINEKEAGEFRALGELPESRRQQRETQDRSERTLAHTIANDIANLRLRREELDLRRRELQQKGGSDAIALKRLALDTKAAIHGYSKELSSSGVPSEVADWVSRIEYNTSDPTMLLKDDAYIALSSAIGVFRNRNMEMNEWSSRMEAVGKALSSEKITGAARKNLEAVMTGLTTIARDRLTLNADMSAIDPEERANLRMAVLAQFPPSLQEAIIKSEQLGVKFEAGLKADSSPPPPSEIPPLFGKAGGFLDDMGTVAGGLLRQGGREIGTGISSSFRGMVGSLPKTQSAAEEFYGITLPDNWESLSDMDKVKAINDATFSSAPGRMLPPGGPYRPSKLKKK